MNEPTGSALRTYNAMCEYSYHSRRAFDLTPNDLDIYRPGDDLLAGQLCDVCDKKKEKAKVYCVNCPKKLCEEHEKVSEKSVCLLSIQTK